MPKELELDNITKKVSHSKLTSFRQILQIVIDTAQDKSIFSHFEVVERDLPWILKKEINRLSLNQQEGKNFID